MQLTTMTITPKIAAGILSKNTKNRRINQYRVNLYADDMRAGRWRTTAEAIIIDKNGELQNGQHRLQAVIKANIPVEFTVITGADPADMDYIDVGVPRSAANALDLHGIPNTHVYAAAAVRIIRLDKFANTTTKWTGYNTPSKPEVVEWVRDHHHELSLETGIPKLAGSTLIALKYLVNRDSEVPDLWDDFNGPLHSGANLGEGDPRLALRNRGLGDNPPKKWGQGQSDMFAAILTWNYWVMGKPVKVLRALPNMLPIHPIA